MPNPAEEKNILENFYENRATILYHDTYHLKDTVVRPNIRDYANGPQSIWESVFPPISRKVYEAQSGFISSSSGGDDDLYPSVNFTTILPASFVAPRNPDILNSTPDASLWIQFKGTALPTAPSRTAPATPASTTSTCKIHVDEYEACGSESSGLFANVSMANSNGDVLDETVLNVTFPLGMPINVGDTYTFLPQLSPAIMITGEHEGDYIQFTQGDMSWTNRTTTGVAKCTNGGWDPANGPVCGLRYGDGDAKNQIDCWVPG
ncbi:hypothetical protein IMSHALPRED_002875 [Imshaugia aleurites]|uniref:Uncharacterized protein n=1 Tax=Imshaugia aleurites TaxID=172621 RepID=A0A8H3PJE1_9LECA|nr:hypothetical protein IMSHALPRED_002875 [Imshaugia aleurites]